MIGAILATAATESEHVRELPMPPWAYGAVALAGLLGLLLVTFAFRSAGTRH